MSEQALNIRISLIDNVSKSIANVTKSINDVGKTIERTGKEISTMGSRFTMLGGIITGAFTVALKQVAEYSPEVNRVFQDMGNSLLELESVIANAVLPIFVEISNVITRITDAFKNMDPQLRQTILQMILISAIVMTFGGIALKVIGTVINIFGNLLQAINPVTIAITTAAAVTILMVTQWNNVRQYVLPVIRAMQIGADMIAIGFLKVLDAILWIGDKFTDLALKLKPMIDALEKFHLLPSGIANAWRSALDGMASSVDGARAQVQSSIKGIESDMSGAMSGVGWAESMNTGIEKVRSFMDQMKGLFSSSTQNMTSNIQNFTSEFNKAFDASLVKVQNLGQQSAQIVINSVQQLSNGFGNAVANMIVKGKNFGESMKAVAEQMAISFISSIVSMIAQWVIFQAIQMAFGPLMVAIASGTAGVLAAIWAPVAAMVSLATLGGNAGPAAAAIATTTAFAYAMAVPKFAEGGIVTRPTLALIGERGPEAVVPLNRSNSYKTYAEVHVHIEGATFLNDELPEKVKRNTAEFVGRVLARGSYN